jgi:4-hydroxy-tetrahydrodipicolinate synthase
MAAITGVYAAAITPRRESPGIDLASVFELLDFLCGGGVDGIALMGSTGEFPHFPVAERNRLVSLAVKRSRVPVLAGVSHSTFDGALAMAREAAAAGAVGVLLMPPYFFAYAQEDVRHFYLRFAEEFKQAAPIVLYDIPAFTTPIARETAAELLSTGLFSGIKDSSLSWEQFVALKTVRERYPFALMAGQDALYTRERMEGADGLISGVASAVPELLVALDHAILAGETERIGRLDRHLQEFVSRIAAFPAPVAIREAVTARGLWAGPPAVPPGPESRRKLDEFAGWFRSWLPGIEKECSSEVR